MPTEAAPISISPDRPGGRAVPLAVASVVLTAALMLLAGVSAVGHGGGNVSDGLELVPFGLLLLAMPVLGLLIVRAQPGNPVGWMFCLTPMLVCASLGFGTYVQWGNGPGILPASYVAGLGWMLGLIGFGLLVPALFPTGMPAGRRWRWLVPADLAALVALALVIVLQPASPGDTANPIGVHAAAGTAVIATVAIAIAALLVAGAVSSVVRYRRAHGTERQQMRLVLWAIILTFVLFVVNSATGGFVVVYGLIYALIPGSIGMAMLRYRLYDVDLIIRRTVTYAALVVALAAIYFAATAVLGAVVRGGFGQSGAVAVTLSTLLAAAAFQPLLARIRQVVDRRFHRAGYDPAAIVEQFGGLLREEIDLDSLSSDLLDVVGSTLHPRQANIWLRPVTDAERGTETL